LPDIIDDLAALVIKPRFWEEEVIPEKPGFVFCMLGDVPVIPALQNGSSDCPEGIGLVGPVLGQMHRRQPDSHLPAGPVASLVENS
jgi:hypothetical protein